jgi:hypothetical protein
MAIKSRKDGGAVTYVGQVVDNGGRSGGQVFGWGYSAVVAVDGGYKRISTGWYYDGDGDTTADAEVDAPADVIAEYRKVVEAAELANAETLEVAEAAEEARRIGKGKRVRVVSGKKVPLGTEGEVFWIGDGKFGTRIGIDSPVLGRVFTAIYNVEVVG